MKIAFIGGGVMARAIINGLISSENYEQSDIIISDYDNEVLKLLSTQGFKVFSDNMAAAREADIIILSVKPTVIRTVLNDISGVENKFIVSIAAGISTAVLEENISKTNKILRVMPNSPAVVGMGISVVCENPKLSVSDISDIVKIFESVGRVEILSESVFDGAMAIGSCSPAFVYMFIEALADGGVLCSLPRSKAYLIAAQAVLGAAEMVLKSGRHPAELKDMVASPGGTTIEGIASLEESGFRSSVINAVKASADKAKKM